MDKFRNIRYNSIALFIIGGAILLMSCKGKTAVQSEDSSVDLITQQSEDLTVLYSKDGHISYRFETPLMERYENAKQPYMEFRKGVNVITFNDSTNLVESTLTANYAIYLESQSIWEAKGNVIVEKGSGEKLETEQLFWDQKAKRIYSNVDSKVTNGSDQIIGVGFESDEDFTDYTFRKPKGKVAVDVEPTKDSTAVSGGDGGATASGVQGAATQNSAEGTADGDSDDKSIIKTPRIREGEAVAKPQTK